MTPSPLPPIDTRFELGDEITPEQSRFLDHYGFLHFRGVASVAEVEELTAEHDRISVGHVEAGRESVYGIPIFYGRDVDGSVLLNRSPFSSVYSEVIHRFVRDPRFEPIRRLIGEDARIGDEEKDGVVINLYKNVPGSFYPRLGWHTDGIRDLFYGRMPDRMLNVGLHFNRVTAADGGLRLIPGTHNQGFMAMAFSKPYFVWHRADPREICVETEVGDLTIHDGRLWHRVARSENVGPGSIRRSMYVPYVTGPYEPKSPDSQPPSYHRLFAAWRALKNRLFVGRQES
jgi:phytanoyl-CoA hydroxylase